MYQMLPSCRAEYVNFVRGFAPFEPTLKSEMIITNRKIIQNQNCVPTTNGYLLLIIFAIIY